MRDKLFEGDARVLIGLMDAGLVVAQLLLASVLFGPLRVGIVGEGVLAWVKGVDCGRVVRGARAFQKSCGGGELSLDVASSFMKPKYESSSSSVSLLL